MSHFNIIKLDAISSTNEFLKKKCKSSKCKDGEIIWAKDQTNGKGQSLNKWLSQRGKSLTVSVYKEFDQLRTSNAFFLILFSSSRTNFGFNKAFFNISPD